MKKTDQPIIVSQTFDSPIEKVWQAITTTEEMKQWFFNKIHEFKPVVGFCTRFIIQVEDRVYPHLWELTEVIPMKKITYDWRYEGYTGVSKVDFELKEEGGNRTKLILTATVIEDFPDNIPEFERSSAVEGWNYFIKKSLKEYLEQE